MALVARRVHIVACVPLASQADPPAHYWSPGGDGRRPPWRSTNTAVRNGIRTTELQRWDAAGTTVSSKTTLTCRVISCGRRGTREIIAVRRSPGVQLGQ